MHFTDAPEIQHFATVKVYKNDNVYGVTWGNLVREYLKTAYSKEDKQADVVSDGVTYKILKRREVTVFYDEDENTLFDVENKRLEKEYGYVMQEDKLICGSEEETDNMDGDEAKEAVDDVKHAAKEKLEKELKADKDKTFAEPVIGYLLKRCEDDLGLAQDVIQEHKTWKKCLDYIYEQARKQATGNRAAVRDDMVYEWAEDYYHRDDKAEEERKAKEAAKRRKERIEKAGKAKLKQNNSEAATPKEAAKPKEEPKRNNREIDGQLDMFSLMGM